MVDASWLMAHGSWLEGASRGPEAAAGGGGGDRRFWVPKSLEKQKCSFVFQWNLMVFLMTQEDCDCHGIDTLWVSIPLRIQRKSN